MSVAAYPFGYGAYGSRTVMTAMPRAGFERLGHVGPEAGAVAIPGERRLSDIGDIGDGYEAGYLASGSLGDLGPIPWPSWPWPASIWIALALGGALGAGALNYYLAE